MGLTMEVTMKTMKVKASTLLPRGRDIAVFQRFSFLGMLCANAMI